MTTLKISSFHEFVAGIILALGVTFVQFQDQGQDQEQERAALDYSADCNSSGCHDAYGKRSVVHDPVSSGDCDSCHEETDEENHRFQLIAEGAELCYECHDEYPEELEFLHGPVAAGSCTVCHDMHASDHSTLLLDEAAALCLKCHSAMKDRMSGSAYKHDPAIEDCVDCHDPHGGGNNMMLTAEAPDLCIDCHDDIQEVMEDAAVSHDAVTEDRACSNCHDPHASDTEHILLDEPMNLCLSCHDRDLESNKGKIAGLGDLLRQNPNYHGPIKEKSCSACHTGVHGGQKFRLLAEEYPSGFYAPFEESRYALCFDCHEPDLVKDERTESLTDFRNGDRNLHYLHVNRRKGRTCRACHETHASARPWHLTESVPFGDSGWEIPIRYEKTENGGSCLCGCHKEYGYDRSTPVANISPKTDGGGERGE